MKLNIVTIVCFVSLGIITESFMDVDARPLFTTTEKVNKQVSDAVNTERKSWQKKVSENEAKIKTLQSDLDKAVAESKKLSTEKTSYEKQAKDDLNKVTREKTDAVNELAKTKKEFETTKKNLDSSISNLRKELQSKEAEKTNLSKKVAETERARLNSESKAKKTLETTKKQYNTKIKRLNTQVSQKTKQLTQKTNELNNLNAQYKSQNENFVQSEANVYYGIEILKGEVKKLKTELKILIANAKAAEAEKDQYIEESRRNLAFEQQSYIQQIKQHQENELKNLIKIEQLNGLIHQLILKNSRLDEAGRILETKLMAKIEALKKQQALFSKKYELVVSAYAKAEAKNLQTIDALKQKLKDAKAKNRLLLQFADKMRQEKIAEDTADSMMEAKTLLKVENLTNELNNAIHKNALLIKNIYDMKKYIDGIKQSNVTNEKKYQDELKALTEGLQKAESEFKELLKKYNNRGSWTKEKLESQLPNALEFFQNKQTENKKFPSFPQQRYAGDVANGAFVPARRYQPGVPQQQRYAGDVANGAFVPAQRYQPGVPQQQRYTGNVPNGAFVPARRYQPGVPQQQRYAGDVANG
ncbi:MAG: hypothetical protein IJS10_01600, partial [Alphaproteobacteria bacterium]|nr:hypothetical protein [Alphaproteobacteria bacterium]